MSLARDDHSLLADWWLTVDRVLLAAVAALLAGGVVLSLTGSSSLAVVAGRDWHQHADRHAVFAVLGAVLAFGVSMLEPRGMRRFALLVYLTSLVAMGLALVFGPEIKGARRWLIFAGQSLQPSEFMKPAFVVLAAWAISERERRPDMPATSVAVALLVMPLALLVLQPDVGQALLVAAVWGAMLLVGGIGRGAMATLAALVSAGFGAAYWQFPHVQARLAAFVDHDHRARHQIDLALQAFGEGGWFGRGPGEGAIKLTLPDAHTDFVLAAIGEELGVVACLILVALVAFIAARGLWRAARARDPFVVLAAVGAVVMLALQTIVSVGVGVGLLPAKGVTLPLVSSGGSSMLGTAVLIGVLLGATRHRHDAAGIELPRSSTIDLQSGAGEAGGRRRSRLPA